MATEKRIGRVQSHRVWLCTPRGREHSFGSNDIYFGTADKGLLFCPALKSVCLVFCCFHRCSQSILRRSAHRLLLLPPRLHYLLLFPLPRLQLPRPSHLLSLLSRHPGLSHRLHRSCSCFRPGYHCCCCSSTRRYHRHRHCCHSLCSNRFFPRWVLLAFVSIVGPSFWFEISADLGRALVPTVNHLAGPRRVFAALAVVVPGHCDVRPGKGGFVGAPLPGSCRARPLLT